MDRRLKHCFGSQAFSFGEGVRLEGWDAGFDRSPQRWFAAVPL